MSMCVCVCVYLSIRVLCYRKWCDDQPGAGSQVFIAIDICGQSHVGYTSVLVQVPVVAQLSLPLKVRAGVHLRGHQYGSTYLKVVSTLGNPQSTPKPTTGQRRPGI